MRRPRIGLTLDLDDASGEYRLGRAYAEAVLAAGGLPVPLPYGDTAVAGAYLALCQGLVITGGDFDIAPELYGEARRVGCGPAKPARTRFEWSLCEAALAGRIPLLGVCGGMQLMNVVRGGSLVQDLRVEAQVTGHDRRGAQAAPTHAVAVVPGSLLARLAATDRLVVQSTHHQAVHAPGAGILIAARAEDGVVEAIEVPDVPFALGVQWHPERLVEDRAQRALWTGLVDAARDQRR